MGFWKRPGKEPGAEKEERPLIEFSRVTPPPKPSAVVYVDYENWFYSLDKSYGMQPNVNKFIESIKRDYTIADIFFFGDFTEPKIKTEKEKIRESTYNIIDTEQTNEARKKDITDFIILDYLYRMPDKYLNVPNVILFSGDAHFKSAVLYLKEKGKNVVVYAVRGSESYLLKCASQLISVPMLSSDVVHLSRLILKYFEYLESERAEVNPTFYKTVHAISEKFDLTPDEVQFAMIKLSDAGILVKRKKRISFNDLGEFLSIEWPRAIDCGYWNPDDDTNGVPPGMLVKLYACR